MDMTCIRVADITKRESRKTEMEERDSDKIGYLER